MQNIYQKINSVMKKIDYVKKDAEIGFGNSKYMAVTHDNVVAMVRPHLVDAGIIIVPDQISGKLLIKKGETPETKMHLYEAEYKISFVNTENKDDFISMRIHAHATDTGDKAPGKTLTYSVKMAILKLFYLETGINDEARNEEPKAKTQAVVKMSEEQIMALKEHIGDNVALSAKIKKAYKVQFLGDIPANNFEGILNRIKAGAEK